MNKFSAKDFTLSATLITTTGNQDSLEKFLPEVQQITVFVKLQKLSVISAEHVLKTIQKACNLIYFFTIIYHLCFCQFLNPVANKTNIKYLICPNNQKVMIIVQWHFVLFCFQKGCNFTLPNG